MMATGSPIESSDPTSVPLLPTRQDSRASTLRHVDSGVDLGTGADVGGDDSTTGQPSASQEDTNSKETAAPATSVRSVTSRSSFSVIEEWEDIEPGSEYRKKWRNHVPQSPKLEYELPKAVLSVRDGWQWTCQSGAVVSGLLAAVAAQLLSFFKADSSYADHTPSQGGAKGFLLASCYAALFLNISATISSFILIDNLGEIGYQASCKARDLEQKFKNTDTYTAAQDKLLVEFGASREWKWMLFHWLATFYSGILALIISVLTYVSMQESLATKIVMGVIVFSTLIPISYFIFRPLIKH